MPEVRAIKKYVRMSPSKLRLVVAMVKNLSPQEAVERLPFSGKRAALPLQETIKSALANAREKGLKETELSFKEIQVTDGPRLKRGRAGARGRWKPYKRRTSHIRVVLAAPETKKGKKSGTKS